MPRVQPDEIKYGLGALAAVASLLLRRVLQPAFGTHYPYMTQWLAVVFCAWYCGVGPSIFAVAIEVLGTWYWFLPPYHSIGDKTYSEALGMVSFVIFSAVIVALGESNRRTIAQHERTQEELRSARLDLEARVRDRTAALEERTAALERAKVAARSLSGRILTLQDDERRRIARGLHDSLGQYLVALKMNLARFPVSDDEQVHLVNECTEMTERCLMETRTVSHLLHPPLLDESGFCSAARWYVDGFAQRSGIAVKLDLPQERVPLPSDVEITLFRVVQESLTNVHRHAGASQVVISLTLEGKLARLQVHDNGRGIPRQQLKRLLEGTATVGVGLAGMRERVRELAGSLEIYSDGNGTRLVVTTTLADRVESEPSTSSASNRKSSLPSEHEPARSEPVASPRNSAGS